MTCIAIKDSTVRPNCSELRPVSKFGLGALLAVLAAVAIAAAAELGYTTQVSPKLTLRFEQQFGAGAAGRLAGWKRFARNQKAATFGQRLLVARGGEAAVLQVVNNEFNQISFVDDRTHWNLEDYWATPAETVASNGGDCEDFAVAKYYMLKELGVPIDRLRITYVRALKLNQAHMVLAYYAAPGAEPLILDNLEDPVRRASERADLEPVYSFNDDDVQIVKEGRKGQPSQIRAWLSLQERLLTESRL